MASAIPQERLAEIVREARARTGVPASLRGCSSTGGWSSPRTGRSTSRRRSGSRRSRSGSRRRSPRCCSISRPRRPPAGERAAGCSRTRPTCARTRRSRCPSRAAGSGRTRMPATCSRAANAKQADGRPRTRLRCASACSSRSASRRTSFEEPPDAAPGHVQDGATGHRLVPDVVYPGSRRRAAGGLWSTVGDLLRSRRTSSAGRAALGRAVERAAGAAGRGARRALLPRLLEPGARGRPLALDHEGSVGGYQSLLLLVPERGDGARGADEQLARERR